MELVLKIILSKYTPKYQEIELFLPKTKITIQ